MIRKIPVLLLSLLAAMVLMAGGYGALEGRLIVSGSIKVIEPKVVSSTPSGIILNFEKTTPSGITDETGIEITTPSEIEIVLSGEGISFDNTTPGTIEAPIDDAKQVTDNKVPSKIANPSTEDISPSGVQSADVGISNPIVTTNTATDYTNPSVTENTTIDNVNPSVIDNSSADNENPSATASTAIENTSSSGIIEDDIDLEGGSILNTDSTNLSRSTSQNLVNTTASEIISPDDVSINQAVGTNTSNAINEVHEDSKPSVIIEQKAEENIPSGTLDTPLGATISSNEIVHMHGLSALNNKVVISSESIKLSVKVDSILSKGS